jgi:acyl-CoA thioesterase
MAEQGRKPLKPWPSHINGNAYSSLKELFAITEIEADSTEEVKVYESIHPAFGPGNIQRAFGGHVYAQAVVAAAKTVKSGFAVHVSLSLCCIFVASTVKIGR